MVSIELDKINAILEQLKGLKIKEAISLRKRLNKEKEKIVITIPEPEFVAVDMDSANRKRSSFMKGVWRYIKLLRDTYPELRENFTSRQMFSQFFARRRGEDVDINDVFWQNPS
jgi:hypothetical protein